MKEEFRVREVEYGNGRKEFYPQVKDGNGSWHDISLSKLPFNDNGKDYCTSYGDSLNVIDKFKLSVDKFVKQNTVVNEKIHNIN